MEDYLDNVSDVLSTGNIPVLTAIWKQAAFQGAQGKVIRTLINNKLQEIVDINQLTPYNLQYCYETEPEQWTGFPSLVNAYDNRYVQQTLRNGDYNQLLQYISKLKGSRIPLLVLKNLCWTYISDDSTLFTLILQVLLRTFHLPEFAVSWQGILDYFFSRQNQVEIDSLLEEREELTISAFAWTWVLDGVAFTLLNSLQSEQTQDLLAKLYVVERDRGLSGSITGMVTYDKVLDTIVLRVLQQLEQIVQDGRLMEEHRNLVHALHNLVANGHQESLTFILEHSQEQNLLETLAVVVVRNSTSLNKQEIIDLPWNSVFFYELQLEIEDRFAEYLPKDKAQRLNELNTAVEQRIEEHKDSL